MNPWLIAFLSLVVGAVAGYVIRAFLGRWQADAIEKQAQEKLSAYNAAQNGYWDGIVEEAGLREALLSALDMLAGKRVPTVAKKHGTV